MARHRAGRRRLGRVLPVVLVLAAVVLSGTAVALLRDSDARTEQADPPAPTEPTTAAPCTTLRVVTASSFEPVLTDVAPLLADGDDCVELDVQTADGRTADQAVTEYNAHVWIPDDTAWAGVVRGVELAEDTAGAGTVVATTPIYMVADDATAARLSEAGGSWLSLADLLTTEDGVRLVVREPADWGDGMVAAGAVGEAVWIEEGMDASAEALMRAFPSVQTVAEHALPTEEGDVGLVPEYALIALLEEGTEGATAVRASTMLPGTDYSAVMRYTWFPTADAANDPETAAAMDRVLTTLTGDAAADARTAAGLRGPDGERPVETADEFPALDAAPFEVLGAHHVEHVFATWYNDDRRSDVLIVIDISGSMAAPAAGSDTPLIALVRDGILDLVHLLPDDAEVALWQFGALLDAPRDYIELLPRGELDEAHREELREAVSAMDAIDTGTGLYDTTLAAYLDGRDNYQAGTPSHVIVFTDGRNEDRPNSITVEELAEELAAANDPERPVQLTVISFGEETDAELLATGLEPVQNYIAQISTAQEVRAVFIHLAAGGRHG